MYAERFIARRYLKAKKEGFISLISGFSLVGIALGVATLIVVMSVMNGFRQELLSRILGLNGHISVYSAYSGKLNDFDTIKEISLKADGVTNIFPVIDGQALITQENTAKGVMIRGMRKEDVIAKATLGNNITAGDINNFKDDGILIGSKMADSLYLSPGDKLSLISPQGSKTPFGIMPRMKTFTIAGIFDVGMYEYDANFIFSPLDTTQKFFDMKADEASYLEIMTEDPEDINATLAQLNKMIGSETRLMSWKQTNSSFFNALNVEKNVMFLILTLIILIAAFNVISSMMMLVKDKQKGIAIMKSMGASRLSIMKIFFFTGSAIGLTGTAIGLGLGLLITNNISNIQTWLNSFTGKDLFSAEIYYLSKLPAEIDTTEVTTIVIIALLLSLLSTIYPAWKASKLDPVEALRYE